MSQAPQSPQEFVDIIRDVLESPTGLSSHDIQLNFNMEISEADAQGATYKELLARRVLMSALAGDHKAISQVLDRLYGKPVQHSTNVNTNINTYYDLLNNLSETDTHSLLPDEFHVEHEDDLIGDLLE